MGGCGRRAELPRGKGVTPEVGSGADRSRTGRMTWSSWMSCGMASRIWTAIFTTFRGGAMVQPSRGRLHFPRNVPPPAAGAPALESLRTSRRPSVRNLALAPVARTHRPGPHSWSKAAAFQREPKLVPGWSPGAGG